MSWTLSTLNVNGIRAAVRKGFSGWLTQEAPDVLCLQELRLDGALQEGEHAPPAGWARVQADSEKKGHYGAAVWSRLPAKGTSAGCGLEEFDPQGRYARMDLDAASVISLYVPSGSSGDAAQARKDRFQPLFLDVSRALLAEGRPMAICGDYNVAHDEIDIHNPRGNKNNSGFKPHERAWMTELLALGWVDLFRHLHPDTQEYSWWSNRGQARALNRGWRIDYILVTPDLAARAEACCMTGPTPTLSDHCAVNARFSS